MILQAQSLGFTLDEIKDRLRRPRSWPGRDYLIGQIMRKLNELDRHIAQVQELRARLVCASNELKTRMKSGAKCEPGRRRSADRDEQAAPGAAGASSKSENSGMRKLWSALRQESHPHVRR